jgi:hypothetical protein
MQWTRHCANSTKQQQLHAERLQLEVDVLQILSKPTGLADSATFTLYAVHKTHA